MHEIEQKNYSKKSCQKLILKCVMKLILKGCNLNDNNTFKQSVKKLLITNNYDNESIFKHLESMVTSQIKSCIDFAKKNIEKYNYTKEYEIIVDELDLKSFKSIKKNEDETLKNDNDKSNPINNIISILECFRRDNLMIRF